MKVVADCAHFFTASLYESRQIQESEIPVYQFCFEYILENMAYLFFIMIYSIIMKKTLCGMLLWITLFSLRSFCGGIHANTKLLCNIISYGIVVIAIPLSNVFVYVPVTIWLISYCISSVLIVCFTPVDTKSRRIRGAKRKTMRRRGLLSFLCISILFLAFFMKQKIEYYGIITFCVMIVAVSMILGIWSNRKEFI